MRRRGWLALGLALMCVGEARAADPAPGATVLADLNPDNDFEVAPPAPIDDCEDKLRAAGVTFAPASLPVREANAKRPTCGAPQAVVYQRGPAKVRYNTPPIVSCGMALGLARFELVLNEEAQRHLGSEVARVEQGGTYNCRKMARFDRTAGSVQLQVGSFDERRATLDYNQSLTRNFALRVNALWQEKEGYRDFEFQDKDGAAIAGAWRPWDPRSP